MHEFLTRIPVVKEIWHYYHVRVREEELASDLFRRWILTQEIKYPEMMMELRGYAEKEGVDEARVFAEISRLYNPSRSL